MRRILLWLRSLSFVWAGHEVLFGWNDSHPLLLRPHEVLIMQYDSRTPLTDYWNVSARWNLAYTRRFGHSFLYLSSHREVCRNCAGETLAAPWCKVLAMLAVELTAPKEIKAIVYLDSDALITVNYSMNHVLSFLQHDLHWSWTQRPIAFNQDGPGYACKLTIGRGYSKCFNSGTVVWLRGQQQGRTTTSRQILWQWWLASSWQATRDTTYFPMDWKLKWPWEQAIQHELYHHHYFSSIQVLSFPDFPFLPWTSHKNPRSQYPTDTIEPYCFSHWPGANCFITHFCASKKQKAKMKREY